MDADSAESEKIRPCIIPPLFSSNCQTISSLLHHPRNFVIKIAIRIAEEGNAILWNEPQGRSRVPLAPGLKH